MKPGDLEGSPFEFDDSMSQSALMKVVGVGGGGGGAGSSAQAAREGALAEKARGSPEPEKALFVLSGPFQNRKLTQNLTCDLLTLRLKFNSTVLSQS